ncbi:MAG: site-specific DNA-methyltransferase [Verrucomicrobiota bacterium]
MSPTDFSAIAAVSSPDHNAERLAAVKQLFPDLFTNEGRLNVDELKKVVDPKLVSETERYDFRWYGKTASKREAFTPSRAALVCDKARSVNPAKAGGNMIIEGENLEVLKLLSSAYRERIKCIYIDPPYNTGKDFVYSDRFAEGQKPYWAQTGVTEDGVKVDTNTDSDGRFHSNWLSMMHSRLLVARYLLRPDGFIVVSIDDAEIGNLLRVMDEVFGEENHIATLVYDKNRKNDARFFSVGHEYMIVFARDKAWLTEHDIVLRVEKEGVEEVKAVFEKLRKEYNDDWGKVREGLKAHYVAWPEDDPRQPLARFTKVDEKGPYRDDGNPSWPGGGGPTYEVLHPVTGKPCKLPSRGWVFSKKETMDENIAAGLVVFGPDETTIPSLRTNLFERTKQVMRSVTFSYAQTVAQEFAKMFDGQKVFDNPKPVGDLRKLFEYLTAPGDLILDFFGGSGTTAQAVMELNKADGGNRQFILVQLPELTAADSPAHKAGFKKISDITIERAKRVIQKLEKEEKAKEPTLFPIARQEELLRVAEDSPVYGGKPQADGLGFKVFKLGKSHFPRVEFAPDPDKTEAENIELLKQYIRDKEATFHIQWERETVLDEVLLKNGFMLDYTLTKRPEFTKNEVFLAKDAHKESLICLDATIAPETVDYFKKHPEPFFICLELALDTTKKWNLKHHLGDKLKAF